MVELLASEAREEWLANRPDWSFDAERNALRRQCVLEDFGAALSLMVRIGFHAERLNHHPEWSNVYNRLDIRLTTHDAGGVTRLDLALAEIIDGLLAAR